MKRIECLELREMSKRKGSETKEGGLKQLYPKPSQGSHPLHLPPTLSSAVDISESIRLGQSSKY